jgi:hypothetical protein
MIRYFVAYAMRNGFGATEIQLRLPVRGMSDIKILADCVSTKIGEPVVILNYQRFEDNAPVKGDQPVPTTEGSPS